MTRRHHQRLDRPEVQAPARTPDGGVSAAETAADSSALHRLLVAAVMAAADQSSEAVPTSDIGEAVRDLVVRAPLEPASWRLFGLAVGHGLCEEPHEHSGLARELADELLLGRLTALLDRGDHAGVARLAAECETRVCELVGRELVGDLTAPLLIALAGAAPDRVGAMLGAVRCPFPRWEEVIDHLRDRSAARAEKGDFPSAEALLAAAESCLGRWRDGSTPRRGKPIDEHRGRLRVQRVRLRREQGDFAGARHLLDTCNATSRDDPLVFAIAREHALVAAALRSPSEFRFPETANERASLAANLGRAGDHLDEALRVDPGDPACRLLRGALAVCRGDDASAVGDLAVIDERAPLPPALHHAVCFHRAAARLRQLEPGTDQESFSAIRQAVEAGYRPGADDLAAVCDALDAHGSARAVDAAVMAASLAPHTPTILQRLTGHARAGAPAAIDCAARLAEDRAVEPTARLDVLLAALDGAEARGDRGRSARLVEHIEALLAQESDGAADERWAERLATDHALRSTIDPAHADADRMLILRRVGRLDESRELAKALLHRALAGALPAFDADELLEFIRELPGGDGDLDLLGELAARGATVEAQERPRRLPGPVSVLVVGGNEVQERCRPHVNEAITRAYAGAVQVSWRIPHWSQRWSRDPRSIEAACEAADAVVLLPFLPSVLASRIRRAAANAGIQLIVTVGHGRASLERAVARAVATAVAAPRAANHGSHSRRARTTDPSSPMRQPATGTPSMSHR